MSSKPNTQAMADRLSGRPTRITIEPATNGFLVSTDKDSPEGSYQPPQKAVFETLDGVKAHLDKHLPAKGMPKKVIDTGKKSTRKVKIVDLSGQKSK